MSEKFVKINEDYMLYIEPKSDAQVDSRGRLIIVADGSGGHAAGDFASRLACTTVNRAYYNLTSNDPRIALRKALEEANAIVFKEAQKITCILAWELLSVRWFYMVEGPI